MERVVAKQGTRNPSPCVGGKVSGFSALSLDECVGVGRELLAMDCANQSSEVCAMLGIDHSSLFYRACSLCEHPLKVDPNCLCQHCHSFGSVNLPSSSKWLYRVMMSIVTDKNVFTVICFDRVARLMFRCSADEFFDFLKFHPFAATTASKVLEGEVFIMKLSKPKNGNAQHLHVTSLVPMMSDYRPAIETLKEVYRMRSTASQSSMVSNNRAPLSNH